MPGPDGVATQQPIHVRQVMDAGPVRRRRDGGLPADRGRRALTTKLGCRGPAARAGAAGPRHPRSQVRRLRRRRGRRPGGADRGRPALAARRHSGGASRLAPPDRHAAADRPVAERPVPQRPGGAGGAAGRTGARGLRSGRHPARAVHVLPPVADARFGDRAHAPRGRRADHGRDRERVPRGRGDHGPADQQGEAADQGVRRAVPDADTRRAGRETALRCCASST